MQRIYNLDKWTRLEAGASLEFSNPMPRTVRIEVNSPVRAELWVHDQATGEAFFLALVEGRDTVEFSSGGAFELATREGEGLWIYTADGADVSMKVEAPETFTKIVERRRRNPELEAIVAVMSRNMERRLEQQSREIVQRIERSQASRPAVAEAASVPSNPPPSPGQDHGAGSSDPQASPAGGGSPPAASPNSGEKRDEPPKERRSGDVSGSPKGAGK